jgi:hypothetical protein
MIVWEMIVRKMIVRLDFPINPGAGEACTAVIGENDARMLLKIFIFEDIAFW